MNPSKKELLALSARVAKPKTEARPWKYVFVLAVIAGTSTLLVGASSDRSTNSSSFRLN